MQRRKFLAGVGSLAAGSAAAMGTGAFTSATAERSVAVNVATDSNAYLGLTALDERATETTDGQLALDFSSGYNGNDTGLNPDARTAFHDLFSIRNNGQNDIAVSVGVRKDAAWLDSGEEPAGTSTVSMANRADLLQDYSGINVVYAYAETDADGNASSVGMGNPSQNRLDAGGRVWRVGGQGTTLSPGSSVDIDLSIETGTGFDPSSLDAADLGLYVFGVEVGGERDISGSQ